MKYIKLLLFLLFISCHNNNSQSKPSLTIKSKEVQILLNGYFDFLSRNNKNSRTVTIDCEISKDSTVFNIINSIPDLSLATITGIKNDSMHTICLIGDMPSNLLLDIEKKEEIIPKYIIEENENSKKKDLVRIIEPVLWTLFFKNNKLIHYEPVKEIEETIPDIK